MQLQTTLVSSAINAHGDKNAVDESVSRDQSECIRAQSDNRKWSQYVHKKNGDNSVSNRGQRI